jgi:hypothetical protein
MGRAGGAPSRQEDSRPFFNLITTSPLALRPTILGFTSLTAELDKLHGWILIPTDTLVKHLSASLLFLTWAFLRYKVFGYGVNEEGLNAKERKQVKRVVKNIEKRGRRNSILAEVPENVKTQIFLTEAVDILLYLSIVPLVMLGTNWKWD